MTPLLVREIQGLLFLMVDRASKLTKLAKVSRRTCEEVTQFLIAKFSPIQEFVLTLTSDNGKEFTKHEEMTLNLEADFFFATPYHSWERGLNEHTNGLVRQYLPKSTKFDEITQKQLDEIELLLNNRPRKMLEFLTPIEAFNGLSRRSKVVALQN